jgi:hypothetical protein
MAKIIGIHGRAGSGKDTIANHLKTYFPRNFRSVAFADPIRAMLKAGFGLSDADFERPLKNEPNEALCGKTPRQVMKPAGTEFGRESIGYMVWINRVAPTVQAMLGADLNVLITDVRFENEAEWIRGQGGVVWHIDRKENIDVVAGADGHKSEAGIKFVKGDVRIDNNETLGTLYDTVEKLAKALIAEQEAEAHRKESLQYFADTGGAVLEEKAVAVEPDVVL